MESNRKSRKQNLARFCIWTTICLFFLVAPLVGCADSHDESKVAGNNIEFCELPHSRIIDGTRAALIVNLEFLEENLQHWSKKIIDDYLLTHTRIHDEGIRKCIHAEVLADSENITDLVRFSDVVSTTREQAAALVSSGNQISEQDIQALIAGLREKSQKSSANITDAGPCSRGLK